MIITILVTAAVVCFTCGLLIGICLTNASWSDKELDRLLAIRKKVDEIPRIETELKMGLLPKDAIIPVIYKREIKEPDPISPAAFPKQNIVT